MKPSGGQILGALCLLLIICPGTAGIAIAQDNAVTQIPAPPADGANDKNGAGKLTIGIPRRVDKNNASAVDTHTAISYLSEQVEAAMLLLSSLETENSNLRVTALGLTEELALVTTTRDQLHLKVTLLTEKMDEILRRLEGQVRELEGLLSLERETTANLYKSVDDRSAELRSSLDERERIAGNLGVIQGALSDQQKKSAARLGRIAALEQDIAVMHDERATLESRLAVETAALETTRNSLDSARTGSAALDRELFAAGARTEALNRQIAVLRRQIGELAKLLESSKDENQKQRRVLDDFGRRLNLALATKVAKLARYRSEFFGRLREALRGRSDVHIVGDRFVFQSEVLFSAGEAELEEPGRAQLRTLAYSLEEIGRTIPADIDWVLRVDGHTDERPIQTLRFPSNWELSTARAISVVKFLIVQGVSTRRVMAAGFAHFRPLDSGSDEIAFRRNRRIEFRLTEK